MFAMFNQLFTAITVFCAAFEKIALTLLHLTGTAEAKAKAFADECAIDNESNLAVLRHRQAQQAKALASTDVPVPSSASAELPI